MSYYLIIMNKKYHIAIEGIDGTGKTTQSVLLEERLTQERYTVSRLEYTSKDNLYAANRTIKRATAAGAGSHVGNEVDLTGTYKFNQYADVLVGYSHLFAGDFLKDTGSADDADYVYVQTTLSF